MRVAVRLSSSSMDALAHAGQLSVTQLENSSTWMINYSWTHCKAIDDRVMSIGHGRAWQQRHACRHVRHGTCMQAWEGHPEGAIASAALKGQQGC